MKKKYYFLSILILFLFNIGGVNAVTSWTVYGHDSATTWGCFGDCNNAYEQLAVGTNFSSWVGLPGSPNTPFYFRFNIAPTQVGEFDIKYEDAIMIYNFCMSDSLGFDITSVTTPPYNYITHKTSKSCTSNFGSGYLYEIIIKTDWTGRFWSSDTVKLMPKTTGSWWLSYKSYDIYTLEQYTNDVYYSQVTESLDNISQNQQQTNEKLDDLNDNLTNSDTSGASGEAENFFSNFNTDTFGLTSVITAPLELIKSVTSKTCTPLHLTLPFVNKNLDLPCLSSIYEDHFGSFLTIYRTITFGFVSYWICIKIFNLVKDFKNPEHDEIEVLDL